MGCICSKGLVKSSIQKNNEKKNHEEESSIDKLKLNSYGHSETSNEISNLPQVIAQVPAKAKEKYSCNRTNVDIGNFYHFSTEVSNELERSKAKDWEELIAHHCNSTESSMKAYNSSNEVLNTEWDILFSLELTKKILCLPERQWINDQIYLINKALQKSKDTGASIKRKKIQLKYQFQWLVWAVGTYFYIYMGGKSRQIGDDFEKLTNLRIPMPETKEQWAEGFLYKSVNFYLLHASSIRAKAIKSEMKAIKILYLESLNGVNDLVFPLVTYIKIGPFILFAVPIYPTTFLYSCNDIYLDLFSKANFFIPSTSVFKLKFEANIFMVYNASAFIPIDFLHHYIVLFDTKNSSNSVYENPYGGSIPKKYIIKLLYGKIVENVDIKQISCSFFGWDCSIFYDSNAEDQSKHPYSDYFEGVPGTFIVFFFQQKNQYKRFPAMHLEGHENSEAFKSSIKECLNILEYSDAISTQKALTELVHSKGLNSYHRWILYSKCRSERTATLLECCLLAKAIKTLIYYNMGRKCQYRLRSFKSQICKVLKSLLKPKTCGPDPCPNLGFILFLSRLKSTNASITFKKKPDLSVSRIIDPLGEKTHSADYLASSEIINKILSVGSRHPKMLLQALEFYLNTIFQENFMVRASNDEYSFLESDEVIKIDDINYLKFPIYSITSLREDSYILYLSLSDKNFINEDSINESQIYLLQKENDLIGLDIIIPGDLYSLSNKFFKDSYRMPTLSQLEEWANCHESLYKGLITPTGEETVLIEIYFHICTLKICQDKNSDECSNILNSISSIINKCLYISADLVVGYYVWNGICQEYNNWNIAEQSYISALLLMTKIFGDPRGRGNTGTPWQMIVSWKLSQIARHDKRIHEAQIAEEHFDSILINSHEYKDRSIIKFNRKSSKQQASIYKNPFESSQEPQWDELFSWVAKTSLAMYQSGTVWSQAELKYIRFTQGLPFYTLGSQLINTSGTSTPSSCKDTKRNLHTSLNQLISTHDYCLQIENTKGVVYVWGTDTHGQLGIHNGRDSPGALHYPRMLTSLKDIVISSIAVGALHCIAITIEGLCYSWGNNESFQLGLGPDTPNYINSPMLIKAIDGIKKAACGHEHSIFLDYNGRVFTVGLGEGGVLGHRNCNNCMYPKMILSLKEFYVAKVDAGGFHSLALTKEGHIYAWGRGEGGQLGIEREELMKKNQEMYVDFPTRIFDALENQRIMQVACGEAHNLALTDEGKVYAWGWGSNGQLGNGYREEDFKESGNLLSIQYTPALILSFNQPIKQISAGGLYSMFLANDCEVYICGANDKQQLGVESDPRDVSIPTRIECFVGYPVQSIFCGESHCVAVSEKLLWTWGNCKEFQLGLGEVSSPTMPRPLQTLTNSDVLEVCCGRMHTLALIGSPPKTIKKSEKLNICWKISF